MGYAKYARAVVKRALPYAREYWRAGKPLVGAYAAGKAIQYGARVYNNRKPGGKPPKRIDPSHPPIRISKKKKRPTAYNSGLLVGKFKKSKRVTDPFKMYGRTGFVKSTEVRGSVSDPDCVYIGHSCIGIYQAYELVACALLRKLFTKIGRLNITDIKDTLVSDLPGDASSFLIELVVMNNESGNRAVENHICNPSDSIYDLVGCDMDVAVPTWVGFRTRMLAYMRGTDANVEPLSLRLFRADYDTFDLGAPVKWTHSGDLDLRNEMVHFHSSSTMKIQNRSLNASGSGDTDTVSTNPIVGYRYGFGSGVPIVRGAQSNGAAFNKSYLFTTINQDTGVQLLRAAQFDATNSIFYEPAQPGTFVNIKNSNHIKLDPGHIKYSTITYTKTMSFSRFLKVLSDQINGGTKIMNIPGSFEMFAFEDVINLQAANKIILAYEVDRKMGCFLKTHKNTFALGSYSTVEFNNV